MRIVQLTMLCLALSSLSCATARTGAWIQAQDAFADGDYRKAIDESSHVLRYGDPSPEERADVYLLQARCYERLSERDEAIGLYSYVANAFPNTPQDYQARAALNRLGHASPLPAAGVPK